MTPVVSYWSSDDMLWMDGQGSDGQGPCATDDAKACKESVKFSGFRMESISGAPLAPPPAPLPTQAPVVTPPPAPIVNTCPGRLNIQGHGQVSVIPTGWNSPDTASIEVLDGNVIVPHLGSRAYFANGCTAGTYNHSQYLP
mmetsp:Transcript_9113/g.28984  ORF Transcript_9113/g.28984 Transcript_9113/m.28984 type:complete len:141 (+) Transcript_9113:2-424(+)